MFRRHHAVVLGLATVLVPVLTQGCSDDTPANPRVTFDSAIAPGTHSSTECPETGLWFKIGSFGNPAAGQGPDGKPLDPVRPIDNGGSDQQGTASVTCSVTPEGDGFHIAATATLDNAADNSGSFRIEGHMTATGDQSNLDVGITKEGRTYTQHDCTAKYTTALQTVAAGRAWAELDCPNAENQSLQRICSVTGEFRFENCAQ
jgi:hypothetical protein